METKLTFRELCVDDAQALAELLQAQKPDYLRFFHPFPFVENEIAARLRAKKKDHWWGLYTMETLAGLVMLRGWDEGYERPSFGIFVGEAFSGKGFARQALRFCIDWCRDNRIPRMMLKVESENQTAAGLYLSEGFQKTDACKQSGQDILELDISPLR